MWMKNEKVPGEGLEPSHPIGHMPLKHACLPISAPGRMGGEDNQISYAHLPQEKGIAIG